ncbi:transcription antitermination factor NusB [Limosilactobacillus fastidiosus]|uniref:Transcription antitermination protein NusB n=1 Tax=Limosilactobacillus fastidiosus TaxID=2759855 RepID=A0A7W3U0Q5_9LACO|nr:transcription antitermination factor NusB [Limosilactobacillus fastidiosus]MBB1063737.1 transcription antitermination factor NusB [Limosilactobacillus fastidiosus]MBB1086734.1 transcription antitermination factor NusB [Limosilactobacillus fastidiosus]MCD7084312.1 transcription antitermination factor NusB [Limosilactobacillus fastidiosus]MCD7085539.1 transcription antitermination factor NusB [Limosilactobacillus fastidiosus]MCD7114770.1 transcription antitermination factor NusB [Limosilactob
MVVNRHVIREEAFQILFAKQSNPDATLADIYDSLPNHPNKIPAYLQTLVKGVSEHQEELDSQVSQLLASGWEINRLAQTDLVILRLALYEIQFINEVPTVVAINEALELAKSYSNDKSRKFINGALGKFERQLEAKENK